MSGGGAVEEDEVLVLRMSSGGESETVAFRG